MVPNFRCGESRVVLGSRAVGAVWGLENVATSKGCERKRSRQACASVVPPRMDVVDGGKPILDRVGTAKSPSAPVRWSVRSAGL